MNIIKKDRVKNASIRGKRFLAAIDPDFLRHLLEI